MDKIKTQFNLKEGQTLEDKVVENIGFVRGIVGMLYNLSVSEDVFTFGFPGPQWVLSEAEDKLDEVNAILESLWRSVKAA